MTIDIARVIIDFGAVVLIWMVQLVVYPSFTYFQKKELMDWHLLYTNRITYIVAPIMFIQSGVITYQSWIHFSILNGISVLICLSLWLFTFLEAVPLHHQIDLGNEVERSAKKLVQINKKRAALWTILFIISLGQLALV